MFNLKNKRVIVTGATGGIGNSIVRSFVENEAIVLATGTNEDKLKNLKNTYNKIHTSKFDISKHENIEKFISDSLNILNGTPDILVNNAGITRDNLSLRMSEKEWNEVFREFPVN